MINLTQKMTLQSKWKRIYLISRFFLYLLFLLAGLLVAYQILFPEISLDYSFATTNSLKNTLFLMRTSASQNPPKNGSLKKNELLSFNANPLGNFKDAKLSFVLDKNSPVPTQMNVKIRKAYSAFFFPTGAPLGFPSGSLLSANGIYYIISDGKARQFVSGSALDQLGFSRSSFVRISADDLKLNPKGDDILSANSYPEDTLIVVGNQYYQFKNGALIPFVSDKAFLSSYDPTQAIPKNEDFLKDKTISENFVGFADGTLASSDQSVFILSGGQSFPIADSTTFLAMGFDWKDVLPLTPGEINAYQRQKQFTVNQPHPNGTIFYDQKENKYFMIEAGFKRTLENQAVIKARLKVSPVLVDNQSLGQNATCQLIKETLTFHTFTCKLNLDAINVFAGNDYQFDADFVSEAKLVSANVVFYTQFSQANTLTSLSLIKNRLQNNYVKN